VTFGLAQLQLNLVHGSKVTGVNENTSSPTASKRSNDEGTWAFSSLQRKVVTDSAKVMSPGRLYQEGSTGD